MEPFGLEGNAGQVADASYEALREYTRGTHSVLKKRFKTESNVRDATRWPLYYTRFLVAPILGVAVICAEWFRFHFVVDR